MATLESIRTRALKVLELAAKATPSPWMSYEGGSCVYANELSFLVAHCDCSDEVGPQHHLDAAFIAASHESAALVRELLAEVELYEAALNRIASWNEGPKVIGSFDEPESAKIARAALSQGEPRG